MTEMIERVARALAIEENGPFFSAAWVQYRDRYMSQARAAIWAMREPTQAMASLNLSEDDSSVYRAMIDAPLEGGK